MLKRSVSVLLVIALCGVAAALTALSEELTPSTLEPLPEVGSPPPMDSRPGSDAGNLPPLTQDQPPSGSSGPPPTQPPIPLPPAAPAQPQPGPADTQASSLSVSITASDSSAFYGQTIHLSADVTGGAPPYSIRFTLVYGGQTVAQGNDAISFTMNRSGQYVATATVTDARGAVKSATRTVFCAQSKKTEDLDAIVPHIKLTGFWSSDITKAAESQLGYTENELNFVADAEGKRRGYTRYGDWFDRNYGGGKGSAALLYGNWCVMFIVFCADIAKIPESVLTRVTGASTMATNMRVKGYFLEPKEHTPAKGDLIFLNSEGKRGTAIDHMGIVVSCANGVITTVEGNASRKVDIRTYEVGSRQVKGFASIRQMQYPFMSEAQRQQVRLDGAFGEEDVTHEPLQKALSVEAVLLYNAIVLGNNSDGVVSAPPNATVPTEPHEGGASQLIAGLMHAAPGAAATAEPHGGGSRPATELPSASQSATATEKNSGGSRPATELPSASQSTAATEKNSGGSQLITEWLSASGKALAPAGQGGGDASKPSADRLSASSKPPAPAVQGGRDTDQLVLDIINRVLN